MSPLETISSTRGDWIKIRCCLWKNQSNFLLDIDEIWNAPTCTVIQPLTHDASTSPVELDWQSMTYTRCPCRTSVLVVPNSDKGTIRPPLTPSGSRPLNYFVQFQNILKILPQPCRSLRFHEVSSSPPGITASRYIQDWDWRDLGAHGLELEHSSELGSCYIKHSISVGTPSKPLRLFAWWESKSKCLENGLFMASSLRGPG